MLFLWLGTPTRVTYPSVDAQSSFKPLRMTNRGLRARKR